MVAFAGFQLVPSPSVTANKLMTNFLHINPGVSGRDKRWIRYFEDIVIVLDGSESIGSCEFNKTKKALKHMMDLAQYARTYYTRFAAVTFARSATVNFKFLPYASAANKIMAISYPNGATNTQAGLLKAKKLFDGPLSGK